MIFIPTIVIFVLGFGVGWYRAAYHREREETKRLAAKLLRIKQDYDIR